jgi:predicted N-acyltransferase
LSLEVTRDRSIWNAWLAGLPSDVRDTPAYYGVARHLDPGEACCARFEADGSVVVYPFLKRRVPAHGDRWDVTSAYDLGGYLLRVERAGDSSRLLASFQREWTAWCQEQRVVSEFVRLHPLRLPSTDPTLLPDGFEHHQDHAVVDLEETGQDPASMYHASHQRSLRRGRRAGLEGSRLSCDDWPEFHSQYEASMLRVGAPHYYRFPRAFFAELVREIPGVELFGVRHAGNLIASALFLSSRKILYYFLGGSDPAAWHLRPNNVLFDHVIRWARAEGFERLHLGGGAPELRRFKMGFGARPVPYYVLRKVHDPETYERLIRPEDQALGPFFPQYRAAAFFGGG